MAIESNGTLLQVAYGGYLLTTPSTVVKESLVYSEPGFTTNSSIEFVIDKSDQFYFIIRKRADIYGSSFSTLDRSNFTVSATDTTLDAQLDSFVQNFSSSSLYYSSQWEDGLSDNQKLIYSVDCGVPIASPINRIRTIDCSIKDRSDNSVIFFRVLVDDSNKVFHYLSVKSNEIGQRNTFSTEGSSISRNIDGKGGFYVLISPFASFNEVDKGEHSFEYPLNTIFYNRQETYNKENFSYQINGFSHDILENSVRVKNIPGYPKMGVIIVDRELYNDISGISNSIYIDVEARGLVSEMRDTFRITFVRI